MKNKTSYIITISLIIILPVIISTIIIKLLSNNYSFINQSSNNKEESPDYYKESKQVKLNLNNYTDIATGKDDSIYITGDSNLLIYKNFYLIKNIKLDKKPLSITVNGNIYICFYDHIEVYSISGERFKIWDSFDKNSILTSIDISNNEVFAADAGNKIILHYDSDGRLLGIINKINENKIRDEKGFLSSSLFLDIAITKHGSLLIAEPGGHTVHEYFFNGEFIKTWEKSDDFNSDFIGCCNPIKIAIMDDGMIATLEKGITRIKLFDKNGKYLKIIVPPSKFKNNTIISGIAFDDKNRLLVLDPNMNLLRIFEKQAGKTHAI